MRRCGLKRSMNYESRIMNKDNGNLNKVPNLVGFDCVPPAGESEYESRSQEL